MQQEHIQKSPSLRCGHTQRLPDSRVAIIHTLHHACAADNKIPHNHRLDHNALPHRNEGNLHTVCFAPTRFLFSMPSGHPFRQPYHHPSSQHIRKISTRKACLFLVFIHSTSPPPHRPSLYTLLFPSHTAPHFSGRWNRAKAVLCDKLVHWYAIVWQFPSVHTSPTSLRGPLTSLYFVSL